MADIKKSPIEKVDYDAMKKKYSLEGVEIIFTTVKEREWEKTYESPVMEVRTKHPLSDQKNPEPSEG